MKRVVYAALEIETHENGEICGQCSYVGGTSMDPECEMFGSALSVDAHDHALGSTRSCVSRCQECIDAEGVLLPKEKAQKLAAWAAEGHKPNGLIAWGPLFDSAYDAADFVLERLNKTI